MQSAGRAGVQKSLGNFVRRQAHRIAAHQPVGSEHFASEKYAARQAEAGIQGAIKGGVELS